METSRKEGTPPRTAVALRYEGEGAPRVTAKGYGEIAQAILERAQAHGIPLYEDAALAAALARLPLGQEIPEALYRACAVVIAFAWGLSGRRPA
jgi:flagellar biosynthesis protein